MHRRDAIRGQRYARRGEAVRGDVSTQRMKQRRAWKLARGQQRRKGEREP
ncbi:hypothetical protein E1A91_A12G054000v1 [Gossypium mustelinum]|uniref:Uncharacterized protein n=1 Tax=Gossypium mustelinum TaxID=34275 RepID=A0A5D2WS25_GOSMU|nr:hypothetical protein E1A91_A12G054000v1 [Gossypium mustelinum]